MQTFMPCETGYESFLTIINKRPISFYGNKVPVSSISGIRPSVIFHIQKMKPKTADFYVQCYVNVHDYRAIYCISIVTVTYQAAIC